MVEALLSLMWALIKPLVSMVRSAGFLTSVLFFQQPKKCLERADCNKDLTPTSGCSMRPLISHHVIRLRLIDQSNLLTLLFAGCLTHTAGSQFLVACFS